MRLSTAEPIPPEVADVLRPALPGLSDEIVAAIGREIDAYRRPLEGPFGRAVRLGTERALGRFLDAIEQPRSPGARRMYVELGSAEFRAGRSLDSLLAAYRLGARLAWRRIAGAGEAAGLEPRVLYRLGELLFAYIDELSAESAEGYARAQSEAADERRERERHLVALLAAEPPAEEAAVVAAAEAAGWRLPGTVAAVVTTAEEEGRLATRLGAGVIAVTDDGRTLALVPDPEAPRRHAELVEALRGAHAALGPAVGWRQTARSIERARLAHRLLTAGVLGAEPLVVADEHLPTLLLHADPRLALDLAERELAPLDALPGAGRRRLVTTLRAWLDHRGRVEEVARRLDVHPQTVRYRLGRLRELFGERLDDPEERLALSLALRVVRAPD